MKALKIKYLKGAFTVFALCLIGTVSAAPNGNGEEKDDAKNTTPVETKKADSYYFKFNGSPGQETDETLWEQTDNPGAEACSGANDGCLIEVDGDFTTTNSSNERILTQPVPVVNASGHLNPDTSSSMILSASNRNP
ncbi:hypothetical protein [Sphingobacterium gobiense]|nr:hypothetical protein [Sphingobacterium gobiense]